MTSTSAVHTGYSDRGEGNGFSEMNEIDDRAKEMNHTAQQRRVVIKSAGSYERLEFESFEARQPVHHEVSIEVKAIGVNYADCMVRMGLYQSAKDFVGWPITPGFEISGIVSAIGPR